MRWWQWLLVVLAILALLLVTGAAIRPLVDTYPPPPTREATIRRP